MRRRFPLIDKINLKILRLQESGIIIRLLTDAQRINSKFVVSKKIKITTKTKLLPKDIQMLIFLLILGYSFATLVFLGELIVRCVRLKMLQLELVD